MKSLLYYLKAIKINLIYFYHKIVHIPFYYLISKKVKILSNEDTVNLIINKKLSVTRFGDGEFELIFGKDLRFQKYSKELAYRLTEVFKSNNKNLLICVNQKMFSKLNDKMSINLAYRRILTEHIFFFRENLNLTKIYGEASFTRFYIDNKEKNRKKIETYINLVKDIWKERNLLIIEGELSRLGVGNDLFEKAKQIKRILCPIKNAFLKYEEILSTAMKNIKDDDLVLIALGPTATILSSELSKKGIQTIDIGHLDIEYMWFLNNANKRIQIKGRHLNEAFDDIPFTEEIEEHFLIPYKKQIIHKIK